MNSYLKLQKREEITQIEWRQKAPGTPFLREWTVQREDDENKVRYGGRVNSKKQFDRSNCQEGV